MQSLNNQIKILQNHDFIGILPIKKSLAVLSTGRQAVRQAVRQIRRCNVLCHSLRVTSGAKLNERNRLASIHLNQSENGSLAKVRNLI